MELDIDALQMLATAESGLEFGEGDCGISCSKSCTITCIVTG